MIPIFDLVCFKFERIESNVGAHNLAKYASCLEPGLYLWLDYTLDPHLNNNHALNYEGVWSDFSHLTKLHGKLKAA
jgi:hypothetical protein